MFRFPTLAGSTLCSLIRMCSITGGGGGGGGGAESINPFGSCTLSENCAHLLQVFALVDTDCSSVLD